MILFVKRLQNDYQFIAKVTKRFGKLHFHIVFNDGFITLKIFYMSLYKYYLV